MILIDIPYPKPLGLVLTILGWMLASPIGLSAQAAPANGETGIYENSTTPINSQAVVDASVFYPAKGDICQIINFILTDSTEFQCGGSGHPKGVVIDARGIGASVPGAGIQCSMNPFDGTNCGGVLNGDNLQATVLLPAVTIQAQKTWLLPSQARVIGTGRNLTIIQACTASNGCGQSFSGSDVIDMGKNDGLHCTSSNDCFGVGIEHLTVDGQNVTGLNGIHNSSSQELSYVRDVSLNNVAGTGLLVDGSSGHSGPYSDIYVSGNGTCAQIIGSNTRGIHGLTCTTTGSPTSAVLLDAANNSIEDVYISGSYHNGILVGANGLAQGNLLLNVNGATGVANVVAISNAGNPSNVSDLSIIGVSTNATRGTAYSIADSLTNTFLQDTSVGMYIVGEPVGVTGSGVGYSRFSTSPNVPAWFVSSSSPNASCSNGSLYSNTSGPVGATLSACVNGSWKSVK
jgi:hypothetical protein